MSSPSSNSWSRKRRLTASPTSSPDRYAAAATAKAGSELEGNDDTEKPRKSVASTCCRTSSTSSAMKGGSRGWPLTSSSGHARTRRTTSRRPASARRSTNRRRPALLNWHATSANTSTTERTALTGQLRRGHRRWRAAGRRRRCGRRPRRSREPSTRVVRLPRLPTGLRPRAGGRTRPRRGAFAEAH